MQATTILTRARVALPRITKRNIGITAPALQKASDPIQQLFLDKIREYKQKSRSGLTYVVMKHGVCVTSRSVEQYFVNIKQKLSYRKPLPILRQRSKSSGLVDNVIAESRRPFSWFVALLYFRVLPLHLSKHKNSTKTNITKLKLNSLLKKHSKLVFILDHIPPPKMRVPPAISADLKERKTSLEIVPISKISNSRGADQKYKLDCNGKAIMYSANHVMPRGLP
ncbi:Atp5jp [Homalodisca vitripennis]|nr:Atp5jp [Homalodisca vitripennis]